MHSAEAKKGSYILTAPLGSAIPLKSSLHSAMRGHHPQPWLDTAWTQPEARACTCAPSVHSRMSRYHEVLSHGTPLVLVAIPACHSLGLQSSQTCNHTPAVQHCQISAPNTPAAKLVQWHHAGKLATTSGTVQNVAVVTLQFMASRDPSHHTDSARMWLVFALWCCESQASVLTGKHPLTPEHKLHQSEPLESI